MLVVSLFSSASQHLWAKGLPSEINGGNALTCPLLWRAAYFAVASANSFCYRTSKFIFDHTIVGFNFVEVDGSI